MRRPSPPRDTKEGDAPSQDAPGKTLQEREAEYEKARSRILKNNNGNNTGPPSPTSPSVTSTAPAFDIHQHKGLAANGVWYPPSTNGPTPPHQPPPRPQTAVYPQGLPPQCSPNANFSPYQPLAMPPFHPGHSPHYPMYPQHPNLILSPPPAMILPPPPHLSSLAPPTPLPSSPALLPPSRGQGGILSPLVRVTHLPPPPNSPTPKRQPLKTRPRSKPMPTLKGKTH